MDDARAGNHRVNVVVDLAGPAYVAGKRVERIDDGMCIAEVDRALAVFLHHVRRRAHATIGLERPRDAARVDIERVEHAIARAKEQALADDRDLRAGRGDAGYAEGPFESEVRHVIGGETGRIACLKTIVVEA